MYIFIRKAAKNNLLYPMYAFMKEYNNSVNIDVMLILLAVETDRYQCRFKKKRESKRNEKNKKRKWKKG